MLTLTADSYQWALNHALNVGDTFALPRPFEFNAMNFDWSNMVTYLQHVDVTNWPSRPHRAVLAPKGKYAFRVITQLDPLDFIIYAALIREIAEDVESKRIPVGNNIVFSYRVSINQEGRLFDPAIGYEQFRQRAKDLLESETTITHVAVTDIADFYNRIYVHRLENALQTTSANPSHISAITKLLSAWNGTETFGIPVGSEPSALLAEITISDIDEALLANGVRFIRYNDDYRLFCQSHTEAYKQLAFLADILYRNHGLTLQPQKTFVVSADQFRERFLINPEEREIHSLKEKLEAILVALGLDSPYEPIEYDDLEPEQQELVDSLNLDDLLQEELSSNSTDFAVVKFVLGRKAQLGEDSMVDQLLNEIDTVYPAFPQIIQYLAGLRNLTPERYKEIGSKVLDLLDNSIISELEYHRMWGLSLFTESTQWDCEERFFRMLNSSAYMSSRRELVLAMGKTHQRHWFQSQWRNLFNEAPWPRRAVLAAASCLTLDARRHWYSSVEAKLDHLEKTVMRWAKANPF